MSKKGKEALLLWCKRATEGYKGVEIKNFHSSWADGLAFCALIHHYQPDLIGPFENLKASDKRRNLELAFTAASKLGIPALLDVEDLIETKPEPISIITYLSQFYHTLSKGARSTQSLDSPNLNQMSDEVIVEENETEECCFKCGRILEGAVIEVMSQMYHEECFGCFECGNELTNKCLNVNGRPYCESCGRKAFLSKKRELETRHQPSKKPVPAPPTKPLPENKEPTDPKPSVPQKESATPSSKESATPSSKESAIPSSKESATPSSTTLGSLPSTTASALSGSNNGTPRQGPPQLPEKKAPPPLPTKKTPTEASPSGATAAKKPPPLPEKRASVTLENLPPPPKHEAPHAPASEKRTSHEQAERQPQQPTEETKPTPTTAETEKPDLTTSAPTSSSATPKDDTYNKPLPVPQKRRSEKPAPSLPAANTATSTSTPTPSLSTPTSSLNSTPTPASPALHSSKAPVLPPKPTGDEETDRPPSRMAPPEPLSSTRHRADTGPQIVPVRKSVRQSIVQRPSGAQKNTEIESSDLPNLEGYMEKKGDVGFIKSFKRRYFALRGDKLVYYEDHAAKLQDRPLGFVPLYSATHFENNATKNMFTITTNNPTREWVLKTDTQDELNKWYNAIIIHSKYKPKESVIVQRVIHQKPPPKEGFLEKLAGGISGSFATLRAQKEVWNARWFVLKDGILWKYKGKEDPKPDKIPLFNCLLEEFTDEGKEMIVTQFQIATKNKSLVLRAKNEEEMHAWLNAILKHKIAIETEISQIEI